MNFFKFLIKNCNYFAQIELSSEMIKLLNWLELTTQYCLLVFFYIQNALKGRSETLNFVFILFYILTRFNDIDETKLDRSPFLSIVSKLYLTYDYFILNDEYFFIIFSDITMSFLLYLFKSFVFFDDEIRTGDIVLFSALYLWSLKDLLAAVLDDSASDLVEVLKVGFAFFYGLHKAIFVDVVANWVILRNCSQLDPQTRSESCVAVDVEVYLLLRQNLQAIQDLPIQVLPPIHNVSLDVDLSLAQDVEALSSLNLGQTLLWRVDLSDEFFSDFPLKSVGPVAQEEDVGLD